MALKTNVIKKPFKIMIEGEDEDLTKWMSEVEVYAESPEAAVLRIPKEYKVLEVREVEEDG